MIFSMRNGAAFLVKNSIGPGTRKKAGFPFSPMVKAGSLSEQGETIEICARGSCSVFLTRRRLRDMNTCYQAAIF